MPTSFSLVTRSLQVIGDVTAVKYYGDGSALTGITGGSGGTQGTQGEQFKAHGALKANRVLLVTKGSRANRV